MPSSSRRRSRSSRICAWMVTSSAVVGSSAIRSFGRQASAIAIITRWRSPPESSCGILLEPALRRADPDQAQQVQHVPAGLRPARPAMQAERLADLEADREGRVERGHRLLEDHPDAVAAHVPHRALVERQQVLALEQDAPALDRRRRHRQQPHDRPRRDALAAARLPDQPDDPPAADGERQIVDHPRRALLAAKPDAKAARPRAAALEANAHPTPQRPRWPTDPRPHQRSPRSSSRSAHNPHHARNPRSAP